MRNVFRVPLLLNAERMVVAHNHCAEYVTPSGNDRKLTKRMQIAGACLGLELIDHIVLGPSGAYYSFRDAGEMPDQQRPRRRKRRPK